jgi:hypothetical protein
MPNGVEDDLFYRVIDHAEGSPIGRFLLFSLHLSPVIAHRRPRADGLGALALDSAVRWTAVCLIYKRSNIHGDRLPVSTGFTPVALRLIGYPA